MRPALRSTSLVTSALVALAGTTAAQSTADSTRVSVSRSEVRIVFPREHRQPWGWAASDGGFVPGYLWSLGGEGVHGYWTADLRAGPDSNEARVFPTLDALVASARLTWCRGGMMVPRCTTLRGIARVEDRRVVIELRDSAVIAELFGLRPERRVIARATPGGVSTLMDSARVDYAEPQLPAPTDSLRAWVAERRRVEQKNDRRAFRAIRVRPSWGWGDTLWAALGDTLAVTLAEYSCSGDVCIGGGGFRTWGDSGWVVGDSTILGAVNPPEPPPPQPAPRATGRLAGIVVTAIAGPPTLRRVAKRAGTTTIHVGGLRPYEDSAQVAMTPPRSLTQVVVVYPKVARVVIRPRPDTVYVGAEPVFAADAFDESGGLLMRVVVPITYPDSGLRTRRRWYEPSMTGLPAGGRRRVVASWRGMADTLTVYVADTLKR